MNINCQVTLTAKNPNSFGLILQDLSFFGLQDHWFNFTFSEMMTKTTTMIITNQWTNKKSPEFVAASERIYLTQYLLSKSITNLKAFTFRHTSIYKYLSNEFVKDVSFN